MIMPDYATIWSTVFKGRTKDQIDTLMSSLGSHWLEGDRPSKNDIIACVKLTEGDINIDEAMAISYSKQANL
ncbi:hypothetical protein [Stomatohabitans albus]|uniref:hypothetical protein n=1 Tax=Stomatohabitans albus TaxID=3110766 RepID=UPI00300D986D